MDIKTALALIVAGKDLEVEEMRGAMRQIMTGEADDAQIGGFLTGLRVKGETVAEITGAVEVMRELVTPVSVDNDDIVDIVGTGGTGMNIFNVSTAASFVVAAAGGSVAKHGNRSFSSKSGAADLLQAAGVIIDLSPSQVAQCIAELGIGFMFAPAHHSAMKYSVTPRKSLGFRTLFNILGPMTNPAGAKRQLVGVYSKALCSPMAHVLGRLGAKHVMVVHSDDGLDEISVAAPTHVAEFKQGVLREYSLQPQDFGFSSTDLSGLRIDSAEQSLDLIVDAFGKRKGKYAALASDMIAYNAGAALYVAGVSSQIVEGVALAQDIISSGLAGVKMNDLATFTHCQSG